MKKRAPPKNYDAWMAARVKHGGYANGREVPEHYIWRSMLARCENPKTKGYEHYGGRGIKVCTRWRKFENFVYDMGPRPAPDYTLDRKNVDGNYTPSNCRWATRSEQQLNQRDTNLYTNGTFTGPLTLCAAHIGLSKELAHWRFKQWGTFEKGVLWHKLKKAP